MNKLCTNYWSATSRAFSTSIRKKIFGLNIFFMFRLYIQKDRAQYSADFKRPLFWKTRLPQMYYVGIYDDLILSLACQRVQCLHLKLYFNVLTLIWDPSEYYVAFDGWKKIFMKMEEWGLYFVESNDKS